ncbi:MAG: FHA domain-containing protein [Myxococcota bacterium]
MAFQLKVSKGKGQGREFSFTQKEVKLGRTPENDVVVIDGGVSRHHARIFEKEGRFFVEDLKSANGTRVNGALVVGAHRLENGDIIALGEEVAFSFVAGEKTHPRKALVEAPVREEPSNTTPGVPLPTLRESDEESAHTEEVEGLPAPPPDKAAEVTREVAMPVRKLDGAGLAGADAPLARSSRAAPAARARGDEGEESAVEYYRRKRAANKSVAGRLVFLWNELSKPARIGAAMGGALLLGGLVSLVVVVFRPVVEAMRDPSSEPTQLAFAPITDSFGVGDDVQWKRADMKVFTFELAAATRAVAVLHYQAKHIEKDEVVISVNGTDQGVVPPDTLDADQRELEQVLSAFDMKRGEQNSLTFDNVKNPPQENPWKVWNLWVEISPLPDLPPEDLLRLAKAEAEKARGFYDQKNVGADNLFKAWKTYRNAWLMLEGLKERPELYGLVRAQMKQVVPELDAKCGGLMLEAQRQLEFKNRKKARERLDEVLRHFPTREHPCHVKAYAKMEEHGL